MSHVIDMAEVQASMETFRDRGKANMELPGFPGVLARLQDAVVPELTYFRTREINNRTDPALMAEAMVMLFAATMASEFRQVTGDPDVHFVLANEVIDSFANTLGRIISAPEVFDKAGVTIGAKEVGHA